jgi:hypothetical protein
MRRNAVILAYNARFTKSPLPKYPPGKAVTSPERQGLSPLSSNTPP